MVPQPPRRTDSAKFAVLSPSAALMSRIGNLSSKSLPLTPLSSDDTFISNGIPPLSSYLQQSTPDSSPHSIAAASGYVASQGFQSHARQNNNFASILNLSINNPAISNKINSTVTLTSQGKTAESEIKVSKNDHDYLESAKNSEYSVDQFMSKILSLDYETSLGGNLSSPMYEKVYTETNYNDDSRKDKLSDVLKVTILDTNENYNRDFCLPRSADFDAGLKKDLNLHNWALSPSNKELTIAPPRRTDSTKNLETQMVNEDIISSSTTISQGNIPKSLTSQEETPVLAYAPSVISLEGSTFTSDIEISDSMSSVNYERTSSNTDSSVSSTIDVKPTFSTLRKKPRDGNVKNIGSFKSFSSDVEFHEMRKQVKKSNNPQIQYDFAK